MSLNILSQEAARLRDFGKDSPGDRYQLALEAQIIEIATRVAESAAGSRKAIDAAFGRSCVQVAVGIVEDSRKLAGNLRYSEGSCD